MKIQKLNFTSDKAFAVLLYLIYFSIFQFLYQTWIIEIFGYDGYESNFNVYYFFACCGLVCAIVFFTNFDASPSSFFINYIIITLYIPSVVLFVGFGKGLYFISISTMGLIVLILSNRFYTFRVLKNDKVATKTISIILFSLSFVILISIFLFVGSSRFNLDFSKVYDFRREVASELPGIFGYINSACTKIIIPFGLVFSVINRRWFMVFLFIMMSILFFGFTQHKAPFFTPFLVLFVYFLAKYSKLNTYFILSGIFILMVGCFDFWLISSTSSSEFSGWFSSLLIRRVLLLPSYLNYIYIDYFSNANFYYWSASSVTFGLVDSQYNVDPAILIGYEHFGRDGVSANAGWIGSGFANAGFIGVFIYSSIIGCVFSILDAYSRIVQPRIVKALFLWPISTIASSTDLITSFVTHGLLYGLFILVIMKPDVASEK